MPWISTKLPQDAQLSTCRFHKPLRQMTLIHVVQASDWFYPFLRSRPLRIIHRTSVQPERIHSHMCSLVDTISFRYELFLPILYPTEKRSQHLYHQHRTFIYREKVRSYLEERLAATESNTKKRLRAAGDNEAMCQAIREKETEQNKSYIAIWETALANHNRKLSNPHADTEYCIGDTIVAQNTLVSKSQVISRSLGPSSSALHDPGLPGDAAIMDWMLIEVADGISVTNKVGHNQDQCVQPTFACTPKAKERVFMYQNNIDQSEGTYVGTTAYEFENQHWVQYQHVVVSWQQLSSFALRGDSGNIVVNTDLEPIGLVIRPLVLPTDDELTFLCDIKEVFNHIGEVLQLLRVR